MTEERRARIIAAVGGTGRDDDSAGALVKRLCALAISEMSLSGCAVVLMSGAEPVGMLGGAGRHAAAVTELQFALGEGPCLQACESGAAVLLPDLDESAAQRWPAFIPAAVAAGVRAEFSLPLSEGPRGIGTFDLCRAEPGMLDGQQLADARAVADIARDAVLASRQVPDSAEFSALLDALGASRLVVHQATGMIAAQLGDSTGNALARLRAAAFESGRSIYDIARDVVSRQVRFDE
jgi:ANTAR domain